MQAFTKNEFEGRLRSSRTDLATLPGYVFVLNQILRRANCRPEDVSRVIRTDASLTAHVLRLANLYLLEGHRPISCVGDAVKVIGIPRLKILVLTAPILDCAGDVKRWSKLQALWQHNYMTAVLSQCIAEECGHPDTELAYTAGLVHHLGELSDLSDPRCGSASDATVGNGEQARRLAIAHQFPAALTEACALQDADMAIHDPLLVRIVNAADLFCRSCGLGLSETPRQLMIVGNESLAPLTIFRGLPFKTNDSSEIHRKLVETFMKRRSLLEFSISGLMKAAAAVDLDVCA